MSTAACCVAARCRSENHVNHVLPFDAAVKHSPDHLTHGRFHRFPERARPTSQQWRHAPEKHRRVGALVGNTPVLWVSEPFATGERGFWAKLEGINPGGMKDRPAMHMVERARSRRDLLPGARIVES